MDEIEIKLSHRKPLEPADILQEDEGFSAGGAKSLSLRATYYDTSDLRLARNGITLRWRQGEAETPVWTLKFPSDGGDATVRRELKFPSSTKKAPKRIPKEATLLVTAFTRGAALLGVADIASIRRSWMLLGSVGEELAEISEDEVTVFRNEEQTETWREIEVEARTLSMKGVRRLADRLVAAGAEEAPPVPKLIRALGDEASVPPEPHWPGQPGEAAPASEAVRLALGSGFRRMVQNDPATRLGEVEPLHQMRVGTRRLRSDLRTFAPLIDGAWAEPLVVDLRWVGGLLGRVRDVDVLRDLLATSGEDLLEDLEPVFAELAGRRAAEHAVLMDALGSSRYVDFLDRLVAAVGTPVLTAEAERPCGEALPPLVERAWHKLATRAMKVGFSGSDRDLHRIRILAKRARYAAEAVAPALGDRNEEALRFASRAARVQDVLGVLQDAAMARDALESLATRLSTDGNALMAAGRLFERQERLAEQARESWPKAWSNLNNKKKRRWMTS
jgi:CHAD domain-containing protein